MRILLLALMMLGLIHGTSKASGPERNLDFLQKQFSVNKEKISYFAEFPQGEGTFPILIYISGSYDHFIGPERVGDKIPLTWTQKGFGIIALERRDVYKKMIDTEKYHYFNTPTQRLYDHLSFVEFLKKNPPKNWNGHIFVFGISEGGPIAVKLADRIKAQACITAVGCSDQSFKEFIWKHINDNFPPNHELKSLQKHIINYLNVDMSKKHNQWLITKILSFQWIIKNIISFKRWYNEIPKTREEYEKICSNMKNNPTHKKFWYGQTYKYWNSALEQSEKEEFLRLDCPVLVIFGSEDVECPATERLLKLAEEKGKTNVSWLQVKGAKHHVFHSKFQPQVSRVLNDFLFAIKKRGKTKALKSN